MSHPLVLLCCADRLQLSVLHILPHAAFRAGLLNRLRHATMDANIHYKVVNLYESLKVFTAVMKYHDQSNVVRKGFIWLMFPHLCSSLWEVRTGTQTGQEPRRQELMQRPWRELSTDLLLMACSACFLTEPRTTAQRWYHPQRAGPSPL